MRLAKKLAIFGTVLVCSFAAMPVYAANKTISSVGIKVNTDLDIGDNTDTLSINYGGNSGGDINVYTASDRFNVVDAEITSGKKRLNIGDEIKLKKTNLSSSGKVAFLPGSRRSEISRLMPVYRELAKKIEATRLLVVPPFLLDKVGEIYGDVSDFDIVSNTPEALYESDFAFVCSGTATLETALIGTPFVLAYKAKAIDVFIARKFVKIKHAGLANIMFDFMGKEPLHEEFIQEFATAENLFRAYESCDRQKFLKGCDELRAYLGHGSSKNVVKILKNME